jgi:hypothetical protein
MAGEKPQLNNTNKQQFKNKYGQTVAGSAWINTRDRDDPNRVEKIKKVHKALSDNDMVIYVDIKDTNGSEDYTNHSGLTCLTLFPQQIEDQTNDNMENTNEETELTF